LRRLTDALVRPAYDDPVLRHATRLLKNPRIIWGNN
jgi:hypothetical protein